MGWCLDNVGVVYRLHDGSRITALAGVSCTIGPGERLAIVGANGSGKSTLAQLLAGIIQPTVGSITHDGGEAATAALVLQNPGDNIIGETVREEFALTVSARPDRQHESDFLSLLDRFGIAHLLDRRSAELSGGETQLVALVCGLLSGRPMIVLDEPTSHLDPPARKLLIEHLLAGATSQTSDEIGEPAVVFITQYRDEAGRFPRVIELEEGRIIHDGPPSGSANSRSSGPLTDSQSSSSGAKRVLLETHNLSQNRAGDDRQARHTICDISVTVSEGDAIGLVGPIGSGKTTLGYHLAALQTPDRGDIEFHAPLSSSKPPVVLIQFPERQLFAETVRDEVAFGAHNRGLGANESLATTRSHLNDVGLPAAEFEARSPFSLSGGQKRRVALASVSVCDASLYILDEPTSALDRDGLDALQNRLKAWQQQGTAYIVISHDIDWLRSVTRRIWVMNEGRLIADTDWDSADCAKALSIIGFLP